MEEFFEQNKKEFEMSMVGELNYFLGLQVRQVNNGIFISQSKYARNLVKKFCLEKARHMRTPMGTNEKLTKDENGVSVDPSLYRSMIGSLLYLIVSRPDICFSVGVYQASPKESHLTTVKRIIRYVSGTVDHEIWFSSDTNSSLAGGCFYFKSNLVTWFSKKQNSISLSTAEVEYIAAGSCCTQLLWMK